MGTLHIQCGKIIIKKQIISVFNFILLILHPSSYMAHPNKPILELFVLVLVVWCMITKNILHCAHLNQNNLTFEGYLFFPLLLFVDLLLFELCRIQSQVRYDLNKRIFQGNNNIYNLYIFVKLRSKNFDSLEFPDT